MYLTIDFEKKKQLWRFRDFSTYEGIVFLWSVFWRRETLRFPFVCLGFVFSIKVFLSLGVVGTL
jgi:hypothetical protein